MTTRRTSPFLGFIALLLALLALALSVGSISGGIQDLILRAWPALLILFGLWLLLRDRVPAAGPIALVISIGAAAALAAAAYSQRAAEVRTDNRIPVVESFTGVERLQIIVDVLNTQLEMLDGSANALSGEFVGARASSLTTSRTDGATTVLTLRESQGDGLPLLDDIGRGTLRLTLPTAIPIELTISGLDGAATLNLSAVALERLEIALGRGDIAVTLPDYQPRSLPDAIANGTIATGSGNITLILPGQVAARLELNRGGSGIEPSYDPTVFNYLVGDVLESRDILSAPFALRYALTTPDGLIRVTTGAN
jgi:hypothetical protein